MYAISSDAAALPVITAISDIATVPEMFDVSVAAARLIITTIYRIVSVISELHHYQCNRLIFYAFLLLRFKFSPRYICISGQLACIMNFFNVLVSRARLTNASLLM